MEKKLKIKALKDPEGLGNKETTKVSPIPNDFE